MREKIKNIIRKINGVARVKKNVFYFPVERCLIGMGGLGGFSLSKFNPYVAQTLRFKHGLDKNYSESLIAKIKIKISELVDEPEPEQIVSEWEGLKLEKYIPEGINGDAPALSSPICVPRNWINPGSSSKKTSISNYYHNYYFAEKSFYPRKDDYFSLKNFYESLREKGYRPEDETTINSTYIQGIILKKNSDFKVLISGGRRRAAALAAMDYKEIPIILYDTRKSMNRLSVSKHQQFLDLKNIENWKAAELDLYPTKILKELFLIRFSPNEKDKAEKLGIE